MGYKEGTNGMTRLRSTLLLGSMLALVAPFATAQEGADPQKKSGADEEVIVTATKRAKNIQDVPISIEVADQKSLERAGVSDLLTLSTKVPALVVNTSNGGNLLRIRGIGSDVVPHYEQSVALYRDGVFMSKSRQNQAPFFDLLRIEILRGPQGALIGKNSSAGAVNLISNNPTDAFEAGLTANYLFDYEGVDLFGYVSGALSDTVSARLALKYKNTEGQLTNFATGRQEPDAESIQGRLTLRYRPTDNVEMITKFEYTKQDSVGHSFFGVPLTTSYKDALDAVLDRGGYTAVPFTLTRPGGEVIVRGDGDRHEQYDFSNQLTIDGDETTFVSLTGFAAYQSRMSSTGRHSTIMESVSTTFLEDFKQISQEFRLQSNGERTFDWVVGIYGDWSQIDYVNPILLDVRTALPAPVGVIPVQQGGFHTVYDMTAYSFSVYATGTWHISDQLDLILGGRYTSVHKSGSLEYNHDFYVAGIAPFAPEFKYDGSLTDTHFDPSVTLQYNVTPDVMLYASFGQGSKPGTFQSARSTTPSDFRLKQEVTTSYEVGIKSTIDGWLTLNASAYHMTMDDFQVSQYITFQNTVVLRATNAATAISRGVEVSAAADLDAWIEGLRLSFSGAYNDAYYDDYPGAQCTTAATALGCNTGVLPGGDLFNARGLPLNNVSKWTGTLAFDYENAVSDSLVLQLSGSLNMFSSYWFDYSLYDPNTGRQPGDTVVNLRIGLTDVDGRWGVALVGENLTDVWRGGQSYVFPGYPESVRVYGIYGGRNLFLQGTLRF